MKQMGEETPSSFPRRAGEELAAARAAQQLDLADIAERTRIPLRHLMAIEAGDYTALPAPTYSTGFVRTFARELGLDEVALASRFRGEVGMAERPGRVTAPFEPADPARVPSHMLVWVTLVLALLLALAYGVWRSGVLTGDTADDRQRLAAGTADEQLATQATPLSGPASTSAAAAPTQGPVTLTATEPVWLKVYERSGTTLFMGELKPGAPYVVPGSAADPLLLTGRPQSLKISVGARQIPPLGDGSKTVSGVSLKPEALTGTSAAAPTASRATPTP